MTEFAFIAKMKSDRDLTTDDVRKALTNALSTEFNKLKFRTKKGKHIVEGRIRTSMINPVVSFVGNYDIEIRDQKARIKLDARSRPNGWFWITLILFFLIFFPLIIILILMVNNQKRRMKEGFERAKASIEHELSDW